ncbi:MAG: hypothetical protein VX609_01585 [Verrucomicrobiota bacterium]|nr:hypothetical protein [Verrucomicrobiota bacterium]
MKAFTDNKELLSRNMNAFHGVPPPLSSEEFKTNSHPKLIVTTAGMPNTQNT